MRRLSLALPALAVLALVAACGPAPDVTGPPRPEAPASREPPAVTTIVSPSSWGPVRVGITEGRAADAMGGIVPDQSIQDLDWRACHHIYPAGVDGVAVMIESGRVSRIEITPGSPPITTDTGLALGATPDQVRAKYPADLQVTPHKYDPAPAAYMTWRNARTGFGIRYVIGTSGVVEAIYAGGPSIEYVEGCS